MRSIDPSLVERGPRGRTIRFTAILDKMVLDRDRRPIGKTHDAFGVRDGPVLGKEPAFRIDHVIAGRGAFGDRLGYDRHEMTGPWPLAALFERLKRGALGFRWDDIDEIRPDEIVLRRSVGELERVPELPEPDHSGRGVGRAAYLALRLLDSQILDRSGHMCGNVDDLELTLGRGRTAPYVSAILSGPGALAHRLGGRLGLWVESVHRRLHPGDGGPARVGFEHVDRVWHQVELDVPREELDENLFEAWVRDRFIARIPGAG